MQLEIEREAINRENDKIKLLSIKKDLAHLNEKSFEDVIRNTKRPVIISHGNAKALCSHRRNYTDKQLLQIKNKNGVVICSIENIDPCGIHTGDSITVAPAQTISDRCYQNLRTMSLKSESELNPTIN